ncbi:hypothetical protein Tco_0619662 [Tanacetum coccineum]
METIGIPLDKYETDENEEGKTLSAGKSSEVSTKLFQKAHLYVIQNTDEIVPYIERQKQVLKAENPANLYLYEIQVEEVGVQFSKQESVSETVRWISYGPRTTVVKYDAYDINGYTFRMKCHDGKVYQNKNIVVNLDSSSDNNNSDSYSTSQISTSEEIDYDSLEPPKSLFKWYHYLSDEYKDNGRFWGSKSGCNESDVKPSWKDIEASSKAKVEACGSNVKVEACGSKAKLQASTKTLIVKSPIPPTMTFAEVTIGKRNLRSGNTDNESKTWKTKDKRNTDKDCIVDSNSVMSKGKYVPVCKKHKPNMYSHVPITGSVLGLLNVTTWDEIEKKIGARKSKTCADKEKGKRKVSCGS